jgi:outer membrane murein-binding lipoprotein Lpp
MEIYNKQQTIYKIMDAIKQNYIYISLVMMFMLLLGQCGSCSKANTVTKKVKELTAEVDSLQNVVVNQEEMIELIKTVPAWKTLRIEEISDKERISINALEEKED